MFAHRVMFLALAVVVAAAHVNASPIGIKTRNAPSATPCPAYITFTNWPGTPVYADAGNYTLEYGFSTGGGCNPSGEFEDSTFTVTRLNGHLNVTSYFSRNGSQGVGTSVPLVRDVDNNMQACITWINFQTLVETQVCSDIVTSYVDATASPNVDPSPYVSDVQFYPRCTQACFAATATFSTIPYFSMGRGHGVTLGFNGDRVDLRPFVHIKVRHPGGTFNTPTQFRLKVQAKLGGGWVDLSFTNGETELHFGGSSDTVRLGGQLQLDTTMTTQVDSMRIVATSLYADQSLRTTVYSTWLVVVNERTSPVARGWTLAGIQRLYVQSDSSVLITEGDGSATYFHHAAPGAYTTPLGAFSQLTVAANKFTRAYPDSTKIRFDNLGRMMDVRDRLGIRVDTLAYESPSSYRLIEIRDALWAGLTSDTTRRLALSYNANGLDSVRDGFGRTATMWVHATSHLLDSIADPGGGKTKFGYDGSTRLINTTDRGGNTTSLAYDSYGRVTSVTAPGISINGGSAQSPVVHYVSWQGTGVPLTATSGTSATAPRPDTIHAKVIDPEGNVTTFTANRWGQPLASTDPLGRVSTVAYNGSGQPVKVTNPYGISDSMAYQSNGLITYQRHASDDPVRYYYNGWATPYRVDFNATYTETYLLDSKGNVWTVYGGGVLRRITWYDWRGRPDSTSDGGGHRQRFIYDIAGNGQIVRDTAPNGVLRRTYYDQYGRDTAVTVGSAPTRVTRYDLLNRVTASLDSAGISAWWTFTYDSLFLRQVTNPRGLVRYQDVNALGWVVSTHTSTAGSVADSTYYDHAGRVTRYRNQLGQKLDLAYDSLSRPTRHWRSDSAGGPNDTTTYSDAARTVRSANANSVVTTYLSALGRVDSTVVMLRPDTVKYTLRDHYTAAGLLDSLVPRAWATNPTLWARGFGYTGSGYLTSLRFGADVTKLARNGENAVVGDTLPTSPALILSRQRMTLHLGFAYGASNATVDAVAGRSYELDDFGRISQEGTNPNSDSFRTYAYDRLGRLRNVTNFNPGTPSCVIDTIAHGKVCSEGTVSDSTVFTYDALGNRTDLGGSYATDDRIQRFNSDTFTLDAAGKVIRKQRGTAVVTYLWTPDGLLREVDSATTSTKFFYDPSDRLVRKTSSVDTAGRYFLWGGGHLLAEFQKTGDQTVSLVAEYSYYPGLDVPHAVRTGTLTVRYFVTDGLGNVTGLATAAASDQLRFDVWGKTTSSTGFVGDTIRPRWKGAFFEPATGLYYLRNRWYDPGTGRFLTEDPAGIAGGGNLYAFASEDPVNARDPAGLSGGGDYLSRFERGVDQGFGEDRQSSGYDQDLSGAGSCQNYDTFLQGCVDTQGQLEDAVQAYGERVVAEVQQIADEIAAEMAGAYVAPDLWYQQTFVLDITDQDGKLHLWRLMNVSFARTTKNALPLPNGAYAIYKVRSWDAAIPLGSNVDILQPPPGGEVWVRSTVRYIGSIRTGGFTQSGAADGWEYKVP